MDNFAFNSLLTFVQDYGYWAVFILVFLQEIGIPNPVPNELILIFAGAMTSIGGLNYFLTFLTAVFADVLGTTVLFSLFYFFEHFIVERIPKWQIINSKLDRIKVILVKHNRWGIFLGRMMPYVRGYVSIAAGILNLPYKIFVPLAAVSALLWSGGYVTLGHFLGKNWETVAKAIEQYKWSFLVFIVSIIGIWIFVKHRKKAKGLVE